MTSLDFLYLSLAIGFLVLVVFINMVLFNLLMALRSLHKLIDNIQDYTQEAVNAKNTLKNSTFGIISKAFRIFRRNK